MILTNGKEFVFTTKQACNRDVRDWEGVVYALSIANGLAITEVIDSNGVDLTSGVMGNYIKGITIEKGKCLSLTIKIKVVDECSVDCPLIVSGQFQLPTGCVADSTYSSLSINCSTCEEVVKCIGKACYYKLEASKPIYMELTTPTTSFMIPAPFLEPQVESCDIEVNSIKVVVNHIDQMQGASAMGFTAEVNGDGSVTITTTEAWGEDTPCKMAIAYSLNKKICRTDFCYESCTVGKPIVEDIGGSSVYKIPDLKGEIQLNSIQIHVQGVWLYCGEGRDFIVSRDDSGRVVIDFASPQGEEGKPCVVSISYMKSELICSEFGECGCTDSEPDGEIPMTKKKPSLQPYFATINSADKYTWNLIDCPVDAINVAIDDSTKCEYVRVTVFCPNGDVGCFVLTPIQPRKSYCFDSESQISQICFEVVEKDDTKPVKDWEVVTPKNPVGIEGDGLDN